eukprot:TRINITY_DN4283_c0_g1_i1.p1 TRINITY_DN4283_c0_g1~~TRINITY_DN4283_c0_g1_i1.p1  ORF type:complete len:625 (-),score=76.08 TRINITY_DN4283_c0_g1_i1:277-2151(-)
MIKMAAKLVKIYNYPTQISCETPLAWSPDHRLAIATKKGIFIYSLVLDPFNTSTDINTKKDFIPTEPCKNPDILLAQERLTQLPLELKDMLLQDRVFASFNEDVESQSDMRYVGWSPHMKIAEHQGHFLIGLGYDYTFSLHFSQNGDGWVVQKNLRSVLLSHAQLKKSDLKDNKRFTCLYPSDPAYRDLYKKAYFAATICISWKSAERLITGQEGGEVVFWKVKDDLFQIVDVYQTDLPSVTAIDTMVHGDRQVIFVGSRDGTVHCLIKSSKQTSFLPVWDEEDRLKVINIKILKEDPKNCKILLAKANFVIVIKMAIDLNKNAVKILEEHAVNAGLSQVVGVEQISVEDAHELTEDTFLIAATKGNMFFWTPGQTDSQKTDLGLQVDRTHYCSWGLTASPNQAIFCLLESVSSFNDHLTMREPGRLVIFTLASHEQIREKVQGPQFMPDYLELFRSSYVKSGLELPDSYENVHAKWWINSVGAQKSQTARDICQAVEIELRMTAANTFTEKFPKLDKKIRCAMYEFLQKHTKDKKILKKTNDFLRRNPVDECMECDVCKGKLQHLELQYVTCGKGHQLPRCTVTQFPLGVPSYRFCSWCNSPYAASVAHSTCILCTGPILNFQ